VTDKVEPEKVSLHLVSAIATDGKASVRRRVLQYTRTKNTLTAVESNEERDAPIGLKRIRFSDLPKVGGIFSTAVAALSEAEADTTLRKVLEARQKKAQGEADAFKAALDLLPKEKP